MSSRQRISGLAALVLAVSSLPACDGQDPAAKVAAVAPASVGVFAAQPGVEIRYPTRLVAAGDGTLYVSDVEAGRVYGYVDGKRVMELGQLARPIGIAVAGTRLYVGSSGRHTVEIYDLAARKFVRTLGDGFQMPSAIAVAPDGSVFVADSKAGEVRSFSASGTENPRIAGLQFPAAIAASDSEIFVGEQITSKILVFNRSGKRIRAMAGEIPAEISKRGDYRGRFSRIQGMALAGGDLYVLDAYHGHVQVLDPATGVAKKILGRLGHCATCVGLALDVSVAADGRVWVTDPDNRRWLAVEAAVEVKP